MAVAYVPIQVNPQTRKSRLMRNIPDYLSNSAATILRTYTMYRPLRVFLSIGALLILGGLTLGGRFLWFYIQGLGGGKVQSGARGLSGWACAVRVGAARYVDGAAGCL